MKSYDFLFWAYNVIWAGIAGFLFFLLLRVRRTERRLDRVEHELEREAGAARIEAPPRSG